ncbi:hypothetical protein ACE6H2_004361 [Prunus campanulata]
MVTALGASCKAVLMLPMIYCLARRRHRWCKTASGGILVKEEIEPSDVIVHFC